MACLYFLKLLPSLSLASRPNYTDTYCVRRGGGIPHHEELFCKDVQCKLDESHRSYWIERLLNPRLVLVRKHSAHQLGQPGFMLP